MQRCAQPWAGFSFPRVALQIHDRNWNKPSTAGFYSTIVLFGAVPVANLLFFVLVGCCWQGDYRVFSDANKDGVHDALEAGTGAEAAEAPAEEEAAGETALSET